MAKTRFEKYTENMDLPALEIIEDVENLFVSKKLKSLLGIRKEPTKEFFDSDKFYDEKGKKLTFEKLPFIKAFKNRKSRLNESLIYKNGNIEKSFYIDSIFLDGKMPSRLLTIFRETASSDANDTLREAVDNLNAVVYSTNYDGSEYYYISSAVRMIFGFTPQEIYENKFLILRTIKKEHFARFKEFIDTLRSGDNACVEYQMKDRYGKEHWVRHNGIPIIRKGKVEKIIGMIIDITEEKINQLKLENSEEKLRVLVDTADDLIFILNGFGYISTINKNGSKTLGFSPQEMTGKHILEFIHKDNEFIVADAFSKLIDSRDKVLFEVEFVDRYGNPIIFEVHAKPLIIDNEVAGIVCVGRNISARKADEKKIKELNSKLIEANRIISIERERAKQKINVLEEVSKLKSEFISNISHELRTPLASIVGFAETISTDSELPPETIREFSNIILTEGKRLAKLINDVLDFSKLESGEEKLNKEEFELLEALNDLLATYNEQISAKELSLSTRFPADKVIIYADKNRLMQAIGNLISNSIKFTPQNGRISVFVENFDREIEIAVTDTGVGIPEKEIPKLFQKFSKIYRQGMLQPGAGFGLALVKQIVDLHKGVIRVISQENKGSTFIIRLPKKKD
ncbi:PAS domain-containing sensor histidine kinase [Melioribacter sp. OK-6-Me]|uniref:sensor histidine kinase n=1 Tax=unclassified Melioribacter TaxID=2627329 RepID=UPI003ED8FD9A